MESSTFKPSGILSMLTDFGLSDPFVGQMHAVVLSHNPSARIVDLCHHVPPQGIAVGAFWLKHSYRHFPAGTVHLAVVDPGVGTERRALVALSVRDGGHAFVAPDNGLLSEVLGPDARAWAIEEERLGLDVQSNTFHGRDLFAPVAARLTSGTPPWEMGPEVAPHRLATVSACVDGDELVGRVVFVDHFGNLVSNLDAAALAGAKTVRVAGNTLPIVARYADVEKGRLLGLVSSFQTLEIAQRDGSASETLGVAAGLEIRVPLPRR